MRGLKRWGFLLSFFGIEPVDVLLGISQHLIIKNPTCISLILSKPNQAVLDWVFHGIYSINQFFTFYLALLSTDQNAKLFGKLLQIRLLYYVLEDIMIRLLDRFSILTWVLSLVLSYIILDVLDQTQKEFILFPGYDLLVIQQHKPHAFLLHLLVSADQ